MPKVVAVRLRYVAKDYWFDPAGIVVEEGDHVVVQTARGKEIGLCTGAETEVEESEIVSPLKPVLRIATEEDLAKADEMNELSERAMESFRDLVEKHELDMKPVRVEFMFTGDFATFYFAADDRIDFRGLVRDLAAEFHVRVDMRQIGVRDEARMLGGLGHCGEELCCARLGGEFQPVSIRMAKEQDLPLNPSKISGLCGRLMCCLRYEFEAYKDFKGRAPKKNAMIDTPMGLAKVVEFDTPRERIRLRMEDGSTMVVPLGSMDTGDKVAKEGERVRPCHIGQEAWDQIIEDLHKDERLAVMGDKLFSEDPTLADKTNSAGAIERTPRRRKKATPSAEDAGLLTTGKQDSAPTRRRKKAAASQPEPEGRNPRRRRRSVSVAGAAGEEAAQAPKAAKAEQAPRAAAAAAADGEAKKPRRRRRRRGGSGSGSNNAASGSEQPKQGGQQQKKQASKPRPGQNSSTLHGDKGSAGKGSTDKGASADGQAKKPRRRRRRRGGSGKGGNSSGAASAE